MLSRWLDTPEGVQCAGFMAAEDGTSIGRMGACVIPYLLKCIDYDSRPSDSANWLESAVLPARVRTMAPYRWLVAHSARNRKRIAMEAFETLGTNGAPALAVLMSRINRPQTPGRARSAMQALFYLNTPAVPAMTTILSHPDRYDFDWAIGCVEATGTNAAPLFPVLIHHLEHSSPPIAALAAEALGEVRVEPKSTIVALTKSLSNEQAVVRFADVEALMKFHKIAKPARPELLVALHDPNPSVRSAATNAMAEIFPEEFPDWPRWPDNPMFKRRRPERY